MSCACGSQGSYPPALPSTLSIPGLLLRLRHGLARGQAKRSKRDIMHMWRSHCQDRQLDGEGREAEVATKDLRSWLVSQVEGCETEQVEMLKVNRKPGLSRYISPLLLFPLFPSLLTRFSFLLLAALSVLKQGQACTWTVCDASCLASEEG